MSTNNQTKLTLLGRPDGIVVNSNGVHLLFADLKIAVPKSVEADLLTVSISSIGELKFFVQSTFSNGAWTAQVLRRSTEEDESSMILASAPEEKRFEPAPAVNAQVDKKEQVKSNVIGITSAASIPRTATQSNAPSNAPLTSAFSGLSRNKVASSSRNSTTATKPESMISRPSNSSKSTPLNTALSRPRFDAASAQDDEFHDIPF